MRNNVMEKVDQANLEEKLIKLNRVAKVVKGGRRFAFAALMVVGDKHGHVGIGYGKANEVPEAIRKGVEKAKKSMIEVDMQNTTIPHEIIARYNGAKVLLKPATEGSGIIAGAPARAVIEVAGIRDIMSKSLGSSNQINIAKAAFEALRNLCSVKTIAKRRGKDVESFYNARKKSSQTHEAAAGATGEKPVAEQTTNAVNADAEEKRAETNPAINSSKEESSEHKE